MKPGRKPTAAMERPRWRCIICDPNAAWIYADEAFVEWQAHYIQHHLEKP